MTYPLWRICRQLNTNAGVKTECLGIRLHAPTAERACEVARELGMFAGLRLVALQESN